MPKRTHNRIGIVLSGFPRLSETFILHELLQLERLGLQPVIFALKNGEHGPLPADVQYLQSPLVYVPERYCREFIREALRCLRALAGRDAFRILKILAVFLGSGKKEKAFHRLKSACRLLWLCRKLQEHGIARLHAHFAHDPTTMAWWASRMLQLPYSFTAHARDIYCYPQKLLQRKLDDAEFVVTCTDYNRRFLEKISPNGTPIYCLYHGIDLQRFTPSSPPAPAPGPADLPSSAGGRLVHAPGSPGRLATAEAGGSPRGHGRGRRSPEQENPDPPHIVAVGRLVEKKGFQYLIDACKLLKSEGVRFRCQIAGDGPWRYRLERQIRRCHLQDEVALLGALSPPAVKGLYAGATLLAMPSCITTAGDRDGLPNVILEAMAMGLPVVATNVSGIPEAIIHGKTGLLVPEKDAAALAAAMRRLLDKSECRLAYGAAAREFVRRNFSLQENVRRKMELLLA